MERFPLARKQPSLDDDCSLLQSGIIDSLGVMDLIGFLGSEFSLAISDEDLRPENFESISCMATFVESKRCDP